MRSVNYLKQKQWSGCKGRFILMFCLLFNLFTFANEPVARTGMTVFDMSQNALTVGVSRNGKQMTLDFHGPNEPYLWRRILETSGAFYLSDAVLSENKIIVSGSFSGLFELGDFELISGPGLCGFYAVFDERGGLLSAGQIESRIDVLVSYVTRDRFGLMLMGTLGGLGFRVPVFQDDISIGKEIFIDLTGHNQHMLRIQTFPGESGTSPDKDADQGPDILVGENPGSNDNPNGDPPPEPPPG